MTNLKYALLLLLAFEISAFNENPYFSIVGPRSVQNGNDYVAILSSTNFSESLELEVSMMEEKTKATLDKQNFQLPLMNKEIRLKLNSQNAQEDYILTANIASKNIFRSAIIYSIEKQYSVLVSTDKFVYKPGDNVNFRILVLDSYTKPYLYKKLTIIVTDANKNKVRDFVNSDSSAGFYQSSFSLSEEPLIGKWVIHVKVDNDKETTRTNFEVRDYVRPRFEAVIDTSSSIALSERSLQVNIFGRYSFGGMVKGKASFNVKVMNNLHDNTPIHELKRDISIDSKKILSLDFEQDLKIGENKNYYLKLSLNFIESLTQTSMTANKNVVINVENRTQCQNQMTIIHELKFKPGFPHKLKIVLRDETLELVQDSLETLEVIVFYYNKPMKNCEKSVKNDTYVRGGWKKYNPDVVNGIAELSIDTLNENNALRFEFRYNRLYETRTIRRAPSRSREYLKATLSRQGIAIEETVSVAVEATHEFSLLYVVIFGRSGVAFSDVFSGSSRNFHSFDFAPTPDMIPEATLLVYYHQPTGEIIYDRVKLPFEKRLPNHLKIEVDNQDLNPGDLATLSMKSTPNSIVFLSAVDKSVNFLRSDKEYLRREITDQFLRSSKPANFEVKSSSRYPELMSAESIILTNAEKGFDDCSLSRVQKDAGDETLENFDDETFEIETTETRKDFPETWLFENFAMKTGATSFTKKVPDSITTWMISGFSLNPEIGLGFATTTKLRVIKDFFIEVEMPRSVILGEIVKIKVFVHNQQKNSGQVNSNIVFKNDKNEFEFIGTDANCKTKAIPGKAQTKNLKVDFNSAGLTWIFIRPTSTGDLKLTISANSPIGNDSVEKTLRVKGEGASHYVSRSVLVDVRSQKHFSRYVTSDIDKDQIMPGSLKVGAIAIANIMGAPYKARGRRTGLDKFYWDLYNLQYLKATLKITDDKKAELIESLLTGYQDLIKMRKADKSFGNVKMTAIAAKTLAHVKNVMEIEPTYTVEALTYLDKKQTNAGGFKEAGDDKESISLTAYAAVAFLENTHYVKRFEPVIKRAINFIHQTASTISNNYELALSAYALVLREDPNVETLLYQLQRNAVIEDNEMHWRVDINKKRSKSTPEIAKEVQIASYALLAYLKAEKLDVAEQILGWLMKNKDGFSSVDEAVVLQALAEAAKIFHSETFKLVIQLLDDEDTPHSISIDEKNESTPVSIELPAETNGISVMANGTGVAALDVWWKYNLKNEKISKNFEINIELDPRSSESAFSMKVCTNFIADVNQTESEMAVMEITMPSGFVFREESKKLIAAADVEKFETRENKSVVLIYLQKLSSTPVCVNVMGLKRYEIADLQKSSVKVYDYYSKSKLGVEYYSLSSKMSCSP